MSQYLGGEEIFSISYKDIDKTKQLAKFLNIYSKTKNLPLLKAEYFDKNNKVAVGKFVNKNCLQFV